VSGETFFIFTFLITLPFPWIIAVEISDIKERKEKYIK
jgi:hypothetical protein